MSSPTNKNLDLLRRFLDPNQSILRFILGTVFLTFALKIIELIVLALSGNSATGQLVGTGIVVLLAAATIGFIILYDRQRLRQQTGQIEVTEVGAPEPHRGLILLVSAQEATAPDSIRFHGETLTHCWLIATVDSLPVAQKLAQQFKRPGLQFYWGEPNYRVDPDRLQSTYDVVVRILEQESAQVQLTATELIADITGGLKPMTAGMTLACLARQQEMVYMKRPRDAQGNPLLEQPYTPIRINTTFYPGNKEK